MTQAPGAEFYGSEAVLLMSYEQQGVYLRLLSIAAANGSIPAEVERIAQLLRLPAKRFAAKVWPAIVACWQQQGDRLVPAGGVLAQEAPPTSPAPHHPTGERTEIEREADRIRQQRKRDRDAGRDVTPVTRDASRSVTRDIDRDVTVRAPSVRPSVPLRVLSSVGPFCSEGEYQRGTEGANRAGDTEGAAGLRRALLLTTYRSNLPPRQREVACTKSALQLHVEGMTGDDLAQLIDLDASRAKKPGGLLATWIDRHQWRAVLDEQRMKAKQASQAERKPADGADDIPPLFAASVANALLRRQEAP
jgi:hypothetical protein